MSSFYIAPTIYPTEEKGYVIAISISNLCNRKIFIFHSTRTTSMDDDTGKESYQDEYKFDGLEMTQTIVKLIQQEAKIEKLFILNIDSLVDRIRQWKRELPQVVSFYPVKANNDPVVLKVFADLGVNFACSNSAEFDSIIKGGFCGSNNIIYANTVKSPVHIAYASKLGIKRMAFDNVDELSKMNKFHSNPELLLQISIENKTAEKMLNKKFGCDPTIGPQLIDAVTEMGLKLVGISFYVGSGFTDPNVFRTAISKARKLFDYGISQGHRMSVLNVGGGFPGKTDKKLKFQECAQSIREALIDFFPKNIFPELEIIAEPGEFLTSPSMKLCTKIIGATKVDTSRFADPTCSANENMENDDEGYMYYISEGLYGGFNPLTLPAYNGGTSLFNENGNSEKTYPSTVWGPSCDSCDRVEEFTKLPKLNVGDWICYENMGAYHHASASSFNGNSPTKTVYVMSKSTWDALYGMGQQKQTYNCFETS